MKFIQLSGLLPQPSSRLLRVPAGTQLYYFDGTPALVSPAKDWPYMGLGDAHSGQYVIDVRTGVPYLDDDDTRPTALLARTGTLIPAPAAPEVPPVDCTDEVAAAITADRAKARIVYS